MKYPIGIQTFEKIRNEGYVYIDKTEFIYNLANRGVYYFLSRPRRFGKSLLISTLAAYFGGKKELFEGLKIAELEKDWIKYPILHLDLNISEYTHTDDLKEMLNKFLIDCEQKYGKGEGETSLALRFSGVVERAYQQTGEKVVILVDEYDKPLLNSIGNKDLQDAYRTTLKPFYGVLKSKDAYIKFALLSGVTKFGKVSVFSDLNNLNDISMDSRFYELCGITEQEIHDYFDSEVETLAEHNGLTKDACYARLKENYDGYHFGENCPGLYNPFSLLNTLDSKKFKDYWFETGTPTYLVELLQKAGYELSDLTKTEVDADVLNSIDSASLDPIPVIYQSGYLTISGYDSEFGLYALGYPNKEVERGFTRFLMPHYLPVTPAKGGMTVRDFVQAVNEGDPELFMRRLEAFMAGGNYQIVGDAELYFHNAVYIIFRLMGFYVNAEYPTSDGRMDMIVQTNEYIYIFEFKIDSNADEALKQIEKKGYASQFDTDTRKLFKIGVNFSSETRKIDGWMIEE